MKNNTEMSKNIEFCINESKDDFKMPGSVQGIEVSNKSNGLRSIYVTSGDESSDKYSDLKIYRYNSKGQKKAEKIIKHTGIDSNPK